MSSAPDILDQLTTAVVVLNNALQVTFVNQAAQSLFGKSSQRVLGADVRRLFVDRSEQTSVLLNTLETGQPFTKRHATLTSYGIGELRADYSVELLGDDELLIEIKSMDRLLRINRDDQHIELQETTRKLVRGLAHEIKNPLGGIRGAAQLLDRELHSHHQHEYTQVIIEEADRLRDLVDRMLGSNERPSFTAVNIHRVLERVVQLIDAERPNRITFARDYDLGLPEIEGDFDKLLQAILNIARNAEEALTPIKDACVELTTRAVRQFTIGQHRHRVVIQVSITDNGPGIPADIAERIYYPMISGRPEGTGLGLSITQSIIGQHNGLLECDSSPGHTVFSMYLPLEQPNSG
jgi:two-component system nitrogen regulation sensor histidine kinase GlnL